LKDYEMNNLFKILSNTKNVIDYDQFKSISMQYHDECLKLKGDDLN